jgi:acyl-CoA synthetase (AMP-forming)/AMP-acid ligase II
MTETPDIRVVADITRHHAARRPDKIALHFQGRETTYGELEVRANRVANALIAAGLRPGDRVALMAKNQDRFFDLFFGAAKAGAVLVPINFRLAPPEVAYIVNDATARLLVVGTDYHDLVAGIRDELSSVETVLAFDGGHDTWPAYDNWRDAACGDDPSVPIGLDDVAMQLYTSGTTGHPKGAQLSHRNLMTILAVAPSLWHDWNPTDVLNVASPLFHVAGCEWAILGLYVGAKNVVMAEVDPAEILASIREHGVTRALFVPAIILFLLQHPDCARTDFSTLKEIYYGASPIPLPVLEEALHVFGCGFIHLYGLTETTGAVTWMGPEDHDPSLGERLKSCGKALPTCEIRVVDEDGRDCPPGTVGEIVCKSAQNMVGYWNQPEENARTLRGDWFHTGDAGYFDADGYLYIYDRVKDMIVSGAENVYPAEVESALMAHPDIQDVAVIGVPDDKWGEAVKAVVVTRPGIEIAADEVVAFARQRIAGYKVPKSVDFAAELPRNPSGKILKRELRRPYWEGQERQVH